MGKFSIILTNRDDELFPFSTILILANIDLEFSIVGKFWSSEVLKVLRDEKQRSLKLFIESFNIHPFIC
jgi:hypothetical protein